MKAPAQNEDDGATDPDMPSVNQIGQAMGPKGLRTRRRLIDTIVRTLETGRLRDLRVSDIARAAGTSTSTFYVYFPDVSDVVLAALDEVPQSTPELLALAGGDWADGSPEVRARRIVEVYAGFWASHHALFRVRNLAADEGDERFHVAREAAIRGLLVALAEAIERAQAAGWNVPPLDPRASASVLMAMLERFAAVLHHQRYTLVQRDRMVAAAAHMIAHLMAPPAG